MQKRKIFLAASMSFYKELVEIEEQLEARGFTVYIPESAKIMKAKNDFEVSHFKGVFSYTKRKKFIHENFTNIVKSDAILVINNEKNGVKGYIGANALMEVGLASYCKKKIYIWDVVPDNAGYKDELFCFDVIYIHKDLRKIK